MSPIKKILKYFFHHSFSGEMVDRVHQRLAEPGDEREKEEVLRRINEARWLSPGWRIHWT